MKTFTTEEKTTLIQNLIKLSQELHSSEVIASDAFDDEDYSFHRYFDGIAGKRRKELDKKAKDFYPKFNSYNIAALINDIKNSPYEDEEDNVFSSYEKYKSGYKPELDMEGNLVRGVIVPEDILNIFIKELLNK